MIRSLFLLFTFITLVIAGAIPRAEDARRSIADRSRMLLYFTRNNAMSYQEYSDYWRMHHAPLFLSTKMVQKNLLRYDQFHVNQEWKKRLRDEGFKVPEYDGVLLVEAETMDKIFETFNNEEYSTVIIPDSLKFSNFSTAVYAGFKITTPLDNNLPDCQFGAIRTDVQTLIGNFAHKTEIEYSNFAEYWSSVNTPNFLQVLHTTGSDKVFSKYELNTIDPVKPTIEIPFNTFLDQWDAVGMIYGPSIKKVFNELKNTQIVEFVEKDAPNFADMGKGIGFVPCDVVSFKIPRA